MLASVLRESGRKALVKTTGSEPVIVFPDGSERKIRRRGPASIQEQIGLVKIAARAGADCLVAEVMSIHPENHLAESWQILQPTIVAITNVRLDHTEAMGNTVEEIASVLSLDITPESAIFVPERSCLAPFATAAESCAGSLHRIPPAEGSRFYGIQGQAMFPENIDLVCAIARHMNLDDDTIRRGLSKVRYDVGHLGIWQAEISGRTLYFVNAFAANDPESTFTVLRKIRERIPGPRKVAGILNLRPDRGPRTLQWIGILKEGRQAEFDRLFVTGGHARVMRRRIPAAVVLDDTPERMTAEITDGLADGSIVFGFGNIKATGARLAEYWGRVGTPYGI